jgi:hypothetical protein
MLKVVEINDIFFTREVLKRVVRAFFYVDPISNNFFDVEITTM